MKFKIFSLNESSPKYIYLWMSEALENHNILLNDEYKPQLFTLFLHIYKMKITSTKIPPFFLMDIHLQEKKRKYFLLAAQQ